MLHQYNNYSNSLNRLLANYQQLEEESTLTVSTNENDLNLPLANSSSQEDSNIEEGEEEPLRRCTINSSTTNKSFTIAAILGLNNNNNENNNLCNSTDLDVVNLSDRQTTTSERASSFEPISCRLPFAVNHRHTSYIPTTAQYHHSTKSTMRNLKSIGCRTIHQQNNKKPCKSKRVRTIFTPEQLERLEAEFEKQQYMVGPERLYLAHTLQLTEAQVKVWFQNRRIKWRKHHLEITHQRLAALKQQQQQQQMLLDETIPELPDTNSSGTDT